MQIHRSRDFISFCVLLYLVGSLCRMVATNTFDASRINNVMADLDPDVNKEHEDALKALNDQSEDSVIKIVKLCKTFQTGRIGNRKDHRALDYVSFICKKGTVTGILGHNGSGKTTTINLLTGVFRASFGDAFIGPYSIQENIQAIRRIIGVCPQKDILWDSMTAREHLKLFCLLKAIPWSEHEETIMKALKNVRLETKLDKRVGTFSGGMKRRLSVAIASIGDPVAIFLDEPSAGLDPAYVLSVLRNAAFSKFSFCAATVARFGRLLRD
jgi:ABC-type Na+ transport system ATPase subunit NatA